MFIYPQILYFCLPFQKGFIMGTSNFKSIVFNGGISVYTHHHLGKCIHGSTKWFQVYIANSWIHFLIKTKLLDVSYYVDSIGLQNLLFCIDMLTFAIIIVGRSMDPSKWFHRYPCKSMDPFSVLCIPNVFYAWN